MGRRIAAIMGREHTTPRLEIMHTKDMTATGEEISVGAPPSTDCASIVRASCLANSSNDMIAPCSSDVDMKHPVWLNVYDLGPRLLGVPIGIGAFHSGVEVLDSEYYFGTGGLDQCRPTKCVMRTGELRHSHRIFVGYTGQGALSIMFTIERLRRDWPGGCYHTVGRNCNDFADVLCRTLTGAGIPTWVNKLARVGTAITDMVFLGPTGKYRRQETP